MNDVVRAWKDPAFRTTLDETQRDLMSANPVGPVGGLDRDLAEITGGDRPWTFNTCFTCHITCMTCWPLFTCGC